MHKALIIFHQAKHAKLTENTDEASNKYITGQQCGNSELPVVELRIRIPDGQVLHMPVICHKEFFLLNIYMWHGSCSRDKQKVDVLSVE